MKMIAIMLIVLIAANMVNVYAQEDDRVIEVIEIPASAFNASRETPEVIPLENKHIANFVVNMRNELVYADNEEAKAAIRFGDNEQDKFFELVMHGKSNRLTISLFIESLGYTKYYEEDNSWFKDRQIGISFMQNEKLSIHNGQRNIMDRLKIGMFTLDTLEVYGRESVSDPTSIIGGKMIVEIFSGNPLDNPITFMPAVAVVIVGGVIIILLKTKKR